MYRNTKTFVIVGASLLTIFSAAFPMGAGSRITYVPPARPGQEKPSDSRNSTNRGCRRNLSAIVTQLAPLHTGLTLSARPVLFYFVKEPSITSKIPAWLTLAEKTGKSAIVQVPLKLDRSGVNRFTLPKDVSLEVEQEYVWTITLVCNRKRPSKNIEIQTSLKRVAPSAELSEQLKKAGTARERTEIYAEAGLWYDLLASVDFRGSIENSPDFKDLLAQIGLSNLTE